MPFVRREGGFTTPAAALAILVVCALVFVCARGVTAGARAGQIQYVADAGALAADNVVAEFVTIVQVADAAILSMSLLALTVYAASAVASFIPGAQGAAAQIASLGSKILEARDKFADSAVKGLQAAQKALPAVCAIRAAQAVNANASASSLPYVGVALTSPMEGEEISIRPDTKVEEAAHEIESREKKIQETSSQYEEARKQLEEAKERAWRADCGNEGMSMYERAGKLSGISPAQNPHFSSADRWSFSTAISRASAYYAARYNAEPGSAASGSPESIGESVARKRFYAYAHDEVSRGYVDTGDANMEIPHLVQLARNTSQIRETSLYTEAIYPISKNGDTRYLHAYKACPTCCAGEIAGSAAVSAIDSGSVQRCPSCKFSATTLGRVPSASTSIQNGFEYHYLAVVEASRDYAQAAVEAQQAERELDDQRETIGNMLLEAASSIGATRLDPQPPGRYGCICIVVASQSPGQDLPFINDDGSLPARIAISGATLAPDAASNQGNVITSIGEGLIPPENIASGPAKIIFGAWGTLLATYANGTEGLKEGFRKVLGAVPVIGTTLSDKAVSTFETALKAAGINPADLSSYKPVLVNSSYILEKDDGIVGQTIGRLDQARGIYGAIQNGDLEAIVDSIQSVPELAEFLDERGITIAKLPLSDLGLGTGERKLILPIPTDLLGRLEELGFPSVAS